MPFRLTGTEPYQVPTNSDLGSMAFQDARGVSIGQANIAYLYVNGGDMTNVQVLDDISQLFNGIDVTFRLSVDNFPVTIAAPEQLMIILGGLPLAPFINTLDYVFLAPTSVVSITANTPSLGISSEFRKGYIINSNNTITFAAPPQPYMDFDGRMLNTSQTRAANRTYPFKPLAIAYEDY